MTIETMKKYAAETARRNADAAPARAARITADAADAAARIYDAPAPGFIPAAVVSWFDARRAETVAAAARNDIYAAARTAARVGNAAARIAAEISVLFYDGGTDTADDAARYFDAVTAAVFAAAAAADTGAVWETVGDTDTADAARAAYADIWETAADYITEYADAIAAGMYIDAAAADISTAFETIDADAPAPDCGDYETAADDGSAAAVGTVSPYKTAADAVAAVISDDDDAAEIAARAVTAVIAADDAARRADTVNTAANKTAADADAARRYYDAAADIVDYFAVIDAAAAETDTAVFNAARECIADAADAVADCVYIAETAADAAAVYVTAARVDCAAVGTAAAARIVAGRVVTAARAVYKTADAVNIADAAPVDLYDAIAAAREYIDDARAFVNRNDK